MNFNNLLTSVLSNGKKILNDKDSNNHMTQNRSGNNFDLLNSFGGGAATAGLLSLLLGSGGGRKMSKNIVKLGSMAAIGTLAYKAYQSWQAQNNTTPSDGTSTIMPTHERTLEQQEQNSEVILLTMIAAANADGRIDSQEKMTILNELDQSDAEAKAWLEEHINQPETPTQIATRVGQDHTLAAECYLAARIICGDLDRKEIIFLHELSEALGLDNQLVDRLEEQAGF